MHAEAAADGVSAPGIIGPRKKLITAFHICLLIIGGHGTRIFSPTLLYDFLLGYYSLLPSQPR